MADMKEKDMKAKAEDGKDGKDGKKKKRTAAETLYPTKE